MPISQKLKFRLHGPDSTFAAIGLATAVCWLAARGYHWVQFLASGREPTLWHPAGVGVALLLLWGYRVWPGVALAAFLTVSLLLNSPELVMFAVGGALFDTLGTAFLTRFLAGEGFQPSLARVRDVAALVSAIFITTSIRAAIAVAVYAFQFGVRDDLWLHWLKLWHGGVLGIILFAPFLLVWTQPQRARGRNLLETAALVIALVAIGVGTVARLEPELALSMVYLVFPLLTWAAIRFQQRGAATAGAILVSVVILSSSTGYSPFLGNEFLAPFALWLPVEISAVSALFISATVAERENALHSSRQLTMVLEATSDLVATADRAGNVKFMNRAGRQLLGIGPDEDLSGMQIADLHPDDDLRLVQTIALPEAIATGTWRGEVLFRTRDGRAVPFSQVIVTRKNRLGEVTHFATIGRDIARQREQEARLRQAQKMDAIGRLAAGVAHDFNNLLTIIRGNCELATPLLEAGDPVREAFDEIDDAGKRAGDLTAQLLAFTRQQVARPQSLDLNAVVEGIRSMLARLLGEHIVLNFEPAAHLDFVRADPGMMDQVILNLAINARDAMPNGGSLTIRTAEVDVAGTTDKAGFQVPPGRYVLLSISDNGVGISEETQAHLFEPFFTTKDVGKGTGLGLATVYGIVKQSDGFITVQSRLGAGATFHVYLPPTAAVPPLAVTASLVELDRDAAHRSILLVEDEDKLRELLHRHLTASGYTVLAARNGPEGLAVCRNRAYAPELLVTDLVMPGMSGRELADQMRTEHPGVKVLFITGYTDEKLVRQGSLPHGMSCLNKPFELRVLAAKVRETLDA